MARIKHLASSAAYDIMASHELHCYAWGELQGALSQADLPTRPLRSPVLVYSCLGGVAMPEYGGQVGCEIVVNAFLSNSRRRTAAAVKSLEQLRLCGELEVPMLPGTAETLTGRVNDAIISYSVRATPVDLVGNANRWFIERPVSALSLKKVTADLGRYEVDEMAGLYRIAPEDTCMAVLAVAAATLSPHNNHSS